MTVDYRYLKAFLYTCEYESFSKAAAELKIAQSAVSRQIKLLEESLELELMVRSSKKIILTEVGQNLFHLCRGFEKNLHDLLGMSSKPINIGVLHGLLESWFIPIITKFLKKFDRSVNVISDNPQVMKRLLESGKLDFIFTTENIQTELMTSLKLFEEKLVLISKQSIDPKKPQDQTWIVYDDDDLMFKYSKIESKQIIKVKSMTGIISLVKAGVGIALVPEHLLKNSENLESFDVQLPQKSFIYLASLNYKILPEYLNEFYKLIDKSRN